MLRDYPGRHILPTSPSMGAKEKERGASPLGVDTSLTQDIFIGKVTIMSRSDIPKELPPEEVSGIFEF